MNRSIEKKRREEKKRQEKLLDCCELRGEIGLNGVGVISIRVDYSPNFILFYLPPSLHPSRRTISSTNTKTHTHTHMTHSKQEQEPVEDENITKFPCIFTFFSFFNHKS